MATLGAMRPPAALLLLALLAASGCASGPPVGADDPALPNIEASEYADAIRLSNGTVNLIIVPSIGGRIMRYGYVGRENVLWNNPAAAARPQAAPSTRPTNYGGDKAWPWPQDDWPRLIGRFYPPPREADQAPFTSRLIGSHGVRLESPPIPSHAARIVREITLDPVGTRVHIVTRLEQATSDRPPPSMAAWSVTQIPGNATLFARLVPDGATKPMQIGPTAPATTRPINDRVVAIDPPPGRAAKLGLDADLLAAATGKTLFIQRGESAAVAADAPGYRPTERAQIFCQRPAGGRSDAPAADRAPSARPYLELEFTSPRRDLAAGEPAELRVTWELRQHRKGWTDESVAAVLLDDAPEPANLLPPVHVP